MSLLSALKSKMWLVQRVQMPKGYINPFGVADGDIQDQFKDIFDVEYMGAAEYEFGELKRWMRNMIDNAFNLKVYSHYLRLRDIGNYNLANIDNTEILCEIYIIANHAGPDGRDSHDAFYKAFTGISHILNTSWGQDKEEVCKSDRGSFYNNVIANKKGNLDYPYNKTIGWLPIKSDFAWFTDRKVANDFTKRLRALKRNKVEYMGIE